MKKEKTQEKMMCARLMMAVAVIVACLAAMVFSAYAYFSCAVISNGNVIQSANFETQLSITVTDTQRGASIPQPITSGDKSYVVTLEEGTTYQIRIEPTDASTAATGFCVITAEGSDNRYHTRQLGVDGDSYTDYLCFYLQVSATTQVKFFAHWGRSAYYVSEQNGTELYITNHETVRLPVTAQEVPRETIEQTTAPAETTEETASEQTEPIETTEETEATEEIEETEAAQQPLSFLKPERAGRILEKGDARGIEGKHRKKKRQEKQAELEGQKKKIEWGSQIRSYVLHPYKMVKDLRTGHETSDTQGVLDGDLNDFMKVFLMENSK